MTAADPLPEPYRFVRRLGAGAFGDVALARHASLGRLVAIKRLHRHALTDLDATERFLREARLLGRLAHPAIVRVFDFVIGDAGAMLVMEYVDGVTLSDCIARASLSATATLTVLTDVADALAAAAAAGIIHRDVKPLNVFVSPDGRAKLGDFGLARVIADPRVFRTATGMAAGTPAYFPPEVIAGEEPDERSDAYSFAVMAFETLTGRLPFSADDGVGVLAAHFGQAPPRADEVAAGFPVIAADALDRALAKNPADRELPAALMATLASIPTEAWPVPLFRPGADAPAGTQASTRRELLEVLLPGPAPVASRRRSTRRAPVIVAASVAAAALAAVTVLVVRNGRSTPPARLELRSAAIGADPIAGRCPEQRFVFRLSLATNGAPGTVTVSWRLPAGRPVEQHIVAERGRRTFEAIANLDLSGVRAASGQAVATITVPGLRQQRSAASPLIDYRC